MTDEWDLGELLAERNMPKDEVVIYLNEEASYMKAQLIKAHAKAKGADVERLDTEIDDINEVLERSKYVVKITGIPSRMREDLTDNALKKYPIKADMWGNDERPNQQLRDAYLTTLIWSAQIEAVVNPSGAEKTSWGFTEVEKFRKLLPNKAQVAINDAVTNLNVESEQYTVGAKGQDFGSTP